MAATIQAPGNRSKAAASRAGGGLLGNVNEMILAVALLGLLVVLLVPLPPLVLDMLLALNLSFTLIIMLITLSAGQPLDFSVFPSILLLSTLYRLALNVATTRLILLNGNAGVIVETFGKVVVGGNLVVGLVIFLILIVIQFVVITKGASRISEVAARFVLDALPGKQMAIDAEMNAGLINEQEARRRREFLVRETEFHGAMDGASKFVRGDAVAALVITGINLVGGILIGLSNGMPLLQATRTYSILTVGDGLISQIPGLIVATAAAMLVTKASSSASLGDEIRDQVTSSPKPLMVGAAILFGLALMPGMPKVPFIALAAALALGGRLLTLPAAKELPKTDAAAAATPAAPAKPNWESAQEEFVQNDRVTLEIGARLIPVVDPRKGQSLLDRISATRREMARKDGLWIPPIRIRDNLSLETDAYRVLVCGRECGKGIIRPDQWLVIDPGSGAIPFRGEDTRDPAFGLPAKWISESERKRAELSGLTVVDAVSVMMTHLGEILRKNASELLGREDLKSLVDRLRETTPSLVDELIPAQLTMGTLHRILCLLLDERVPITNLGRIMESLAHHVPATKDPLELVARVRVDLRTIVCDRFRDANGRLQALLIDPRVELDLRRALVERTANVDTSRLEKLAGRAALEWKQCQARGQNPAIIVEANLRRPLRQFLGRSVPELAVLSYEEIPHEMAVQTVGMIRLEDLA